MKLFFMAIFITSMKITCLSQSFTFPTSGNAVNSQLSPLVAPDGVTLVTSIRSTGCTPGAGSNFQYNTSHVSTGAIYRNTSWAAGCINSKDIITMDFSTVTARPLGIKFTIFDVDNGSDSVSVEIYSYGSLVDYSYTLYSPTFVSANGSSPTFGFNGSSNNNSGLDDNRGSIDIVCIDPMVRVDSIVVRKYNNRDVTGNPSQSYAAFQWNNYVILPLRIISFSGVQNNNLVKFNWDVSQETGIKFYQVEYSVNGENFLVTGNKVAAKGRSTEPSYTQTMPMPSESNLLFFRLAATDNDGNKSYSKTVKIKRNILLKALVYPTNFKNTITLSLESDKTSIGNIKLVGMDGKVYYKKPININKGNNIVLINLYGDTPLGIYHLIGDIKNAIPFSYKLIKE